MSISVWDMSNLKWTCPKLEWTCPMPLCGMMQTESFVTKLFFLFVKNTHK